MRPALRWHQPQVLAKRRGTSKAPEPLAGEAGGTAGGRVSAGAACEADGVDDMGPCAPAGRPAPANAAAQAAAAHPTLPRRGRERVRRRFAGATYSPNTTSAPWSVGMLVHGSPYSVL